MEKIAMIFRKEYNPNTKSYEPIAFIPELPASYGRISCYSHMGQHSEADFEYYKQTQKATFDEYKELLKELECVYSDMKIIIKQRLNSNTIWKSWQ